MISCAAVTLYVLEVVFAVVCAGLAGSAIGDYNNVQSVANAATSDTSNTAEFAAGYILDLLSSDETSVLPPSGFDTILIFVTVTAAAAAALALMGAVRRLAFSRRSRLGSLIELIVFCIWAVFWLAAVIALAVRLHPFACSPSDEAVSLADVMVSSLNSLMSHGLYFTTAEIAEVSSLMSSAFSQMGSACDEILAAWAFALLSLLVWLTSIAVMVVTLCAGRRGGKAAPLDTETPGPVKPFEAQGTQPPPSKEPAPPQPSSSPPPQFQAHYPVAQSQLPKAIYL